MQQKKQSVRKKVEKKRRQKQKAKDTTVLIMLDISSEKISDHEWYNKMGTMMLQFYL